MSKLKLLPYSDLKKVAEKCGFQWARCRGSHNTFKNSEGKIVVIPDHGSQVIVRPLLHKIIKDLGINTAEYREIVENL